MVNILIHSAWSIAGVLQALQCSILDGGGVYDGESNEHTHAHCKTKSNKILNDQSELRVLRIITMHIFIHSLF